MNITEARNKAEEVRETVLSKEDLGFPALMALATRFRIIFRFGDSGVWFSEKHGHWILEIPEEAMDRNEEEFLLACGIGGILLETDEQEAKEAFARTVLIPEKPFLLALKNGVHEETLSIEYSVPVSVIRERKREFFETNQKEGA